MRRFLLLLTALLLLLSSLTGCYSLHLPRRSIGVLRYEYRQTQQTFSFTEEETRMVRRYLNEAEYRWDGAGCAFQEGGVYTYTLCFDNRVIVMAHDDCPTVWDVERDRYYEVSDEGWAYLTDLCIRYLGFPEYPHLA